MLRQLNRGYMGHTNVVRSLITSSLPKEEHTFESEWETAIPYAKIPGPSTFQLLKRFLPGGKYHNFSLIDIHARIRAEYGPICKLPGTFGRRDIVFCFDPKDFEKVYRNEGNWPERKGLDSFVHYRKHVRPDVFKNMGGLLSEQGQSWATLRHKVNPVMLQPKTVKSYIPQVDEIAVEFVAMAAAARDGNNELRATFGHDLNKWALESIGAIALDQRLGVMSENSPEAKLLIKSIRDFFRLSYELDVMPSLWHYVETPKFKKLMQTFDNMTDLVLKYVDRGIEALERNDSSGQSNREPGVMEKLLKIDKHAAVVMTMDMILAGVDTTASAAVACLYHLAKNPDKQELLRKEIRSILPAVNGKLHPDSFSNIPYLRACFKEAIRLSPIVAGGIRSAGQDIVLQGFQIPKGVDIGMAGALLQHDEENYPYNDEFIPERWLKDEMAASASRCPSARSANPFIYLPFGFGARACIGRRFAEIEVEILLCRIVRQYQIEWNHPPIKYMTSLIQTPVSDLKFKLTEINE